MSSGQDLVEEIVTLIENNITDINTSRANSNSGSGKKWVYDDLPASTTTGYPRIGVINPTSGNAWLGMNSNDENFKPKIEIQIRVKKGSKWDIGGDTYRDVQALDYLSKQVSDLLKQDSTFTTLHNNCGVFHFTPASENTVYGEVMIRQLVYDYNLRR